MIKLLRRILIIKDNVRKALNLKKKKTENQLQKIKLEPYRRINYLFVIVKFMKTNWAA